MIKILLLIIGSILIVFVGINLKYKFKIKLDIVNQLIYMINRIKNEMTFNKKFIDEIIKSNLINMNLQLKQIFEDYLINYKFNFNLFDNDENNDINSFFNLLGENDLETEITKCTQSGKVDYLPLYGLFPASLTTFG